MRARVGLKRGIAAIRRNSAPVTRCLLQFELDRARQVGKPFVNPVQAPYMKKMAGFSHFVICEPYFAAMWPVQERFIDNPERLLLRGPDPSLPVLSDDYRCQYQYCVPQTVGNDEWVLFHLVDEALGAAPVFTPDPPWSFAHGVHLIPEKRTAQ